MCQDPSAIKPAFDLGGYGCVGEPGQTHPMCWKPHAVHVECWIKCMTTGTSTMCPNGCPRTVSIEDMQSATAINFRRLRGIARLRQAQDRDFEVALEADRARDLARAAALTTAPVTAQTPVTALDPAADVHLQRRLQSQRAAESRRAPAPGSGPGAGAGAPPGAGAGAVHARWAVNRPDADTARRVDEARAVVAAQNSMGVCAQTDDITVVDDDFVPYPPTNARGGGRGAVRGRGRGRGSVRGTGRSDPVRPVRDRRQTGSQCQVGKCLYKGHCVCSEADSDDGSPDFSSPQKKRKRTDRM
jgi:hypothetical protein